MQRKERITVSLSKTSARFLRAFRAKEHAGSMSALFETMVEDLQNRVEMEQLDVKIAAYYDALPQARIREDYDWGALGEATLAAEAEQEYVQPQLAGATR